jgi:gas vesicle protein
MIFSTREAKKKNLKRLAVGSSMAAVAGYLAGILTAPKSGQATRQDIKKTANKGVGAAEKELKNLHTDLDKALQDARVAGAKAGTKAKQELNELVAKAKDAKEKSREIISAVREGEASYQELSKAVKQGRNALNNLKTYLKK